jgi:ribosomal protein L11
MKLQALIRLKIFSQEASSKEPVGPTLGQFGIPIMDFCKKFNSLTEKYLSKTLLNVVVMSYGGQKYDFIIKFPDYNFFIQKCFSTLIGVQNPGFININNVKYMTPFMLFEIIDYVYKHSYYSYENNVLSVYKKVLHSFYSGGGFCYY